MAITQPILAGAISLTNVQTEDGYLTASLKVVSGPPVKIATAALAALEFVARLGIFIVAGAPRLINPISSETYKDLSKQMKSAGATSIRAITAIATTHADENDRSSSDASKKSDNFFNWMMASAKNQANAFYDATVIQRPLLTAAVVGTITALAICYFYPSIPEECPPLDLGNNVDCNCPPLPICKEIPPQKKFDISSAVFGGAVMMIPINFMLLKGSDVDEEVRRVEDQNKNRMKLIQNEIETHNLSLIKIQKGAQKWGNKLDLPQLILTTE